MFLNIYCKETQHLKKYIFFYYTVRIFFIWARVYTFLVFISEGEHSNNFQFVRGRGAYLFSKLLFCNRPTAQVWTSNFEIKAGTIKQDSNSNRYKFQHGCA